MLTRILIPLLLFLLVSCAGVGYSSAWVLYGVTSGGGKPRKILLGDDIRDDERVQVVGNTVVSKSPLFFIKNYPHYFGAPDTVQSNYLYMFHDSLEYTAEIRPSKQDLCLDSTYEKTACVEHYYHSGSRFRVVSQFQIKLRGRSRRNFVILEDSVGLQAEFDMEYFPDVFTAENL